jgi:transcriptional regulator with XRE-family HTH domain
VTAELDRLKAWMTASNMDARELAKQTGFSYPFVYRIMSGLRPASEKFKWAFFHAYGQDTAIQVFAGEAKKDRPHIYQAQKALTKAVKDGKLLPASSYKCHACPKQAREFHHPSYHPDDYLCVVPLCSGCHRKADRGKLNVTYGVVPTRVGMVRIAISDGPTP